MTSTPILHPILQREALVCRRSEPLWSESQDAHPGILAPRPHSYPFLRPPYERQRTSTPAPGQACLWKAETAFAFLISSPSSVLGTQWPLTE